MKIFSSLVFLLITNVVFTSCDKESDPDPQTSPKADYISASPWKYENAGIDNDKNGTIDVALSVLVPGAVQACRTDNILTFKKDNTGITDEGTTKCNAADPQSTNFNWSFADNETNLNISNNTFPILNGKSRIVTLNETAFALSRDTTLGGTNVTLVVTLKH
jgi:hypothetical protein